MEQIVAFLTNHWILSSLFLILLISFVTNEWVARSRGVPSIPPQALVDLLNHADAKVIDIRAGQAFSEGHILGSVHMAAKQIPQKLEGLRKYQEKPLILICSQGIEAAKVAVFLQSQGFKQVMFLQGGLQNWRAAGLPLQKKS